MEWIAIPFAAATVVAHPRRRGARPAPRPLAADADRAHRRRRGRGGALRRAPRGVREPRRRRARSAPLAGAGFVAFFLAERVLVLHHRDDPDAGARPPPGRHPRRARPLRAQLHRRPRDRARLRARHRDRRARLRRRDQPRLRRRPEHGQLRAQPIRTTGARRERWLAIDAGAPLVGAIVGSAITVSEATLGGILAVYAGFFLYMGATDLLPEAHSEHASWPRVALTCRRLRRRARDQRAGRRLARGSSRRAPSGRFRPACRRNGPLTAVDRRPRPPWRSRTRLITIEASTITTGTEYSTQIAQCPACASKTTSDPSYWLACESR